MGSENLCRDLVVVAVCEGSSPSSSPRSRLALHLADCSQLSQADRDRKFPMRASDLSNEDHCCLPPYKITFADPVREKEKSIIIRLLEILVNGFCFCSSITVHVRMQYDLHCTVICRDLHACRDLICKKARNSARRAGGRPPRPPAGQKKTAPDRHGRSGTFNPRT